MKDIQGTEQRLPQIQKNVSLSLIPLVLKIERLYMVNEYTRNTENHSSSNNQKIVRQSQ